VTTCLAGSRQDRAILIQCAGRVATWRAAIPDVFAEPVNASAVRYVVILWCRPVSPSRLLYGRYVRRGRPLRRLRRLAAEHAAVTQPPDGDDWTGLTATPWKASPA
jgi:hypothetical protein